MRISIVTVTYNSEATVRDTLESVLRQDYADYELIIKDGSSTDGTIAICREYEPRFDGRMKFVTAPDEGMYDAMNTGIALATGEIVGVLNSDDFYTSDDILSTVAGQFEQTPEIDAVYGDVHYVTKDTANLKRYFSGRLFRRGWMRFSFMPAHPSFYCKKATYERFRLDGSKVDGFKGDINCAYYNTSYKIAADFEFLLRTIYVGKIQTRYISKDFVTMRCGGVSNRGISSHLQINRDHLRAFRENGVYSNILFLSVKYLYRIWELAIGLCNGK